MISVLMVLKVLVLVIPMAVLYARVILLDQLVRTVILGLDNVPVNQESLEYHVTDVLMDFIVSQKLGVNNVPVLMLDLLIIVVMLILEFVHAYQVLLVISVPTV